VRTKHLKPLRTSAMHGEVLDRQWRLPLAFVYGGEKPVYRRQGKRLRRIGVAENHARLPVERVVNYRGKSYVSDGDRNWLPREGVRIARAIKRPGEIPANERWIAVDLSEQTLVAYQGNRPVFATLISSGKEGYQPPTGAFRIYAKHVTVTMNGSDPIDGWYEVEEVPWTQYYHEGYAIHGAYWHNEFGNPRSHGCTNLSPADSRWLFHWTSPDLRVGWHGIRESGTWIYFSA
jgi:hypothetical protein